MKAWLRQIAAWYRSLNSPAVSETGEVEFNLSYADGIYTLKFRQGQRWATLVMPPGPTENVGYAIVEMVTRIKAQEERNDDAS